MMCIHDDLARALETLELLDLNGRIDFLVGAALETGGYYKAADLANSFDSQAVEIRAHNVSSSGPDDAAAVHYWMQAARRQVEGWTSAAEAAAAIRSPAPISNGALRAACDTILSHSLNAADRIAATAILQNLDRAQV